MSRLVFSVFAAIVSIGALFATSNTAQADSVLVLGAESYDGDSEFAANLTGALRHATGQVSGWTLSDREVSLGQMMLVHGCEYANQDCLGRIAAALEVDLLVYAEIRQIAGRNRIDVGLYSRDSGTIVNVVQDNLAPEATDIDDLRTPARRYVTEIAGAVVAAETGETGTLVVYSSGDGAEVLVNGSSMGTISGDSVTLELPEGEHQITVGGGDFSLESESAVITAGETSELTLDVEELDGSSSLYSTLALTSLGVGIVATVTWVASWIAASNAGPLSFGVDLNTTDDDATAFIETFQAGLNEGDPNDYCVAARDAVNAGSTDPDTVSAHNGCENGGTYETLSIIGLALAGVGFGASAIFFWLDSEQAVPGDHQLSLHPTLGLDHAGLDAVLTF